MSDDAHDDTPRLEPIPYATPDPDKGEGRARTLSKEATLAAAVAIPVATVLLRLRIDSKGELLLCLAWAIVLPCLAIGFGLAAKFRLGSARGQGRLRNSATAAIWLGAAEVVLISAVMTLSPIVNARPGAARLRSAGNLRMIGQGLVLYTNEYGAYPPDFATLLVKEDLTADVFINPRSNDTIAPGADKAAQATILTTQPGHCSYVFAAPNATTQPANPNRIDAYETPVDPSGTNFLFGDSHVEWVTNPGAQRLIAELKAGYNPPRTTR